MRSGYVEIGDMHDCGSCGHRHELGGTCVPTYGPRIVQPDTPLSTSRPILVQQWTNLDDALAIVTTIDRVRAVIRELRAAFARSELDGGVNAAPDHPLYQDAEAKLAELRERLLGLI